MGAVHPQEDPEVQGFQTRDTLPQPKLTELTESWRQGTLPQPTVPPDPQEP